MGNPIAVSGCTLVCNNLTAQATIQTPPSTKVTATSPCYRGVLSIMVSGASQGKFVQTAPTATTLTGTATKVFIEGMPAVLMGDKSVPAICVCTDASTGVSITIPVTVTIANAGQTKVIGS